MHVGLFKTRAGQGELVSPFSSTRLEITFNAAGSLVPLVNVWEGMIDLTSQKVMEDPVMMYASIYIYIYLILFQSPWNFL